MTPEQARTAMLEKERDALAEKYCRLESAAMLALVALQGECESADQFDNAVTALTVALS